MEEARVLLGSHLLSLFPLLSIAYLCLERAQKLCKTRLLHGPKFREAGETYIQVSNICLTAGEKSEQGDHVNIL